MSYEVLDNSLYSEKKYKHNNKNSKKKRKFNPLYIHILLIIIILISIFLYFEPFNFMNDEKTIGNLILVGDLKNFNQIYTGDLEIDSSSFYLKTKDIFEGESKNFKISNFDGLIYLKNDSLIFLGTGNNILFDKNKISLNNQNFKLISKQKTKFVIYLKKIKLDFLSGRIKLDDNLNFNFINSSININDINLSIVYDGVFSISGRTKKFNLNSPSQKLNINFENDKIN